MERVRVPLKDHVGIVAVMDPRMKTRSYGKFFLETLPQCLLAKDMGAVEEFLKRACCTVK